jgi:thioredoxin reductase (NADPH)
MFPVLEPKEIERARRFGEVRVYERGEAIVVAGNASPGVIVILCGKIDVTQRDPSESRTLIVTHERGGFMGELAQLAGRPSLVDAYAQERNRPTKFIAQLSNPIPRVVPAGDRRCMSIRSNC